MSGTLYYRQLQTPTGSMLAAADDAGICLLEFCEDDDGSEACLRRLPSARGTRPVPAERHAHLDALVNQLREYFAGDRQSFTLPVAAQGTEFQRRAWAYLLTIPFGQTRSYGAQARALGDTRAVRAVGRANGSNPLAILVPCHRVIGATGHLTGYAGGIERKRWLLEHEQRFGDGRLFSPGVKAACAASPA